MKKKIFSLLIVISMLMSMFIIVPNVSAAAKSEVVIQDFTDSSIINTLVTNTGLTSLSVDTENAPFGATCSAKWNWNTSVQNIISKKLNGLTETDWSQYDSVKVSLYASEATGEAITIVPTIAAGVLSSGYYYSEIKLDFTGWKDIIIPRVAFVAGRSPASWNITGLQIKPGTWATASADVIKTTVNIGRISLINSEEYTLMSFRNTSTNKALGFTSDTTVAAENAVTSGKWEYSSTLIQPWGILYFSNNNMLTDWSAYKTFKMRMYSDKATGDYMTVALMSNAGGKVSTGAYYYYELLIDFEGWKDIIIDFSEFKAVSKNGAPSWELINGLMLQRNLWSDFSDTGKGTVLNFDSFSIVKEKTEPAAVLLDFTDEKTATAFNFELSDEVRLNSDTSAKWEFKGPSDHSAYTYLTDNNGITDWSPFTSLNFWAYSECATNDTASIVVSTTGSLTQYWIYYLKIDWTGWKKVTIPLGDFSSQKGAASWSTITGINLYGGDWSTAAYNPETVLYLDKMWLDSAPSLDNDLVVGDMVNDSFGTKMTATYIPKANYTEDTTIKNMYESSIKWENHATNTIIARSFSPYLDITEYTSFNFSMYSEVANNAVIYVTLMSPSGVEGRVGAEKAWYIVPFTVDWTGWKTISVPISEFSSKYEPSLSTISAVYFDSRVWNSVEGDGPKDDTSLNIEKVWFSKPASIASEEIAPKASTPITGTKNLAVTNRKFVVEYTSHLSSEVDLTKIAITKNDVEVSGYNVGTFGNNLEIIFEENLDVNSTYKINIGDNAVQNVYGKYASAVTLSYDTIANWISDISITLDDNTRAAVANVETMGENMKATLILAIYSTDGILKNVVTDSREGTDVSQVLTCTLTPNVGETAKAILVNEETFEPLVNSAEITRAATDELSFASVFASNAVLQRDRELTIWGNAPTGSEVTVTLDEKTYTGTADEYGKWSVVADAISVDGNPYTLTVTDGKKTVEKTDILAGDVWLCGGQSNMAFKLYQEQTKDELLANTVNENIRFFTQTLSISDDGVQNDVTDGTWSKCVAATARNFSAIGYLFGKELQAELNVPIGLIEAAVGGSCMEAWISKDYLISSGNENLIDEIRNGYCPSTLYNTMLAPLAPFGIKGVIWYQGEANDKRHENYTALTQVMLENWREIFNYDFPFIYAQLPKFGGSTAYCNMHYIREAQLNLLDLDDNVAMAVFTEAGDVDDSHPKDKVTPAHRMALAALGKVYGKDVQWKFPRAISKEVSGSVLTVSFEDVYDGLEVSGPVTGFQLCGADGVYYDAEAFINTTDTSKVDVICDQVAEPVGVRYGFVQCPDINLYNSAGLIASPFRMD